MTERVDVAVAHTCSFTCSREPAAAEVVNVNRRPHSGSEDRACLAITNVFCEHLGEPLRDMEAPYPRIGFRSIHLAVPDRLTDGDLPVEQVDIGNFDDH